MSGAVAGILPFSPTEQRNAPRLPVHPPRRSHVDVRPSGERMRGSIRRLQAPGISLPGWRASDWWGWRIGDGRVPHPTPSLAAHRVLGGRPGTYASARAGGELGPSFRWDDTRWVRRLNNRSAPALPLRQQWRSRRVSWPRPRAFAGMIPSGGARVGRRDLRCGATSGTTRFGWRGRWPKNKSCER